MNNLHQTLSSLAIGFAVGLIALQAWKSGMIEIDPKADFFCAINGIQQSAQGTRVMINIKSTHIVWTTCSEKNIQASY